MVLGLYTGLDFCELIRCKSLVGVVSIPRVDLRHIAQAQDG